MASGMERSASQGSELQSLARSHLRCHVRPKNNRFWPRPFSPVFLLLSVPPPPSWGSQRGLLYPLISLKNHAKIYIKFVTVVTIFQCTARWR